MEASPAESLRISWLVTSASADFDSPDDLVRILARRAGLIRIRDSDRAGARDKIYIEPRRCAREAKNITNIANYRSKYYQQTLPTRLTTLIEASTARATYILMK